MDNSIEVIQDLILELSLVSTLPIGAGGRNLMRASAAANAMAYRTENMERNELRNFEWTIQPLLDILVIDLSNPLTAKAALCLRMLMPSRICMTRFLEKDGLQVLSRVLDILLAKKVADLKNPLATARMVVEHLAVCYREIARFYQWAVVDVGGIRHCVLLLRFGDIVLKTITASTLASLSSDLEICKQMFSYGAIKPLIEVSDGENTNEACMLAGLGCITQLCRIPEIGSRMVQQGAIRLMEKAVHKQTGHGNKAIREKALYTLGFLSKIPNVRGKVCTPITLTGIRQEFLSGTMSSKMTTLQLLMHVHKQYAGEAEFIRSIRDPVLELLKTGPWNAKNLCLKVTSVLYRTDEDRWHFVQHDFIEAIMDVIAAKHQDLQEAPLVALINICAHADIPPILIAKGGAQIAADLLRCEDAIIRELAVVLLKVLLLYSESEVTKVVPKNKEYILKRDIYNPQLFGEEYGGLIQEFLQMIVENRRDQDYLKVMFTKADIKKYQLTDEELEDYSLTFMELDAECRKYLGVDELKLLMVCMGERMDKEEIVELLEQYDEDKSGNLDFKEFVIMMKGWNDRFGTGLTKIYRTKTERGAIGKARRQFKKWREKGKIEEAEVQLAKERRLAQKQTGRELEVQFMRHEQMRERRLQEMRLRSVGESQFSASKRILPPIEREKSNKALLSSRPALGQLGRSPGTPPPGSMMSAFSPW